MSSDADERPNADTAPKRTVADEATANAAGGPPSDAPPPLAADVPAAETPAEPAAETPAEPAADAPAADTPAETAAAAPAEPAADAPAEPAADAPAEPAADAPAEPSGEPAPSDAGAETSAEAAADVPAAPSGEPAPADAGAAAAAADAPKKAAKKPRRRKPRERRKAPELPKTRAPLPLDELRDASRSTMNLFGPRKALRDALGVLAPREKQELNVLIAADEDHRPRARNIANGSIGAGRIDKAMAATIVSMAPQEELWSVLLDKEQAAQKLGRIREAKQRDKQRADRAAERANRADRVSREDMAKASDGRVGATIRFVSASDEKRERREKDAAKKKSAGSVLDRLGY